MYLVDSSSSQNILGVWYNFSTRTQFVCLFVCLFIYWLCWVFVAACGLFLVMASGGYSLFRCAGFSLRWLLFVAEQGLQGRGLQQLWLEGSRAQAQQLWRTGLVALRHVGSSWTRACTCVPCVGRRILNHRATREVPGPSFYVSFLEEIVLKKFYLMTSVKFSEVKNSHHFKRHFPFPQS